LGLLLGGLIFESGGGGGGIFGGTFALEKWFSLYLEGILQVKMTDFSFENAAPEGNVGTRWGN